MVKEMKLLEPYHLAWLAAHPKRSEQWLRDHLADGFQVHHIDKNPDNHEDKNLILIEGQDHLSIFHGMKNVDLFVFHPANSAHMKRISALGNQALAKKRAPNARQATPRGSGGVSGNERPC